MDLTLVFIEKDEILVRYCRAPYFGCGSSTRLNGMTKVSPLVRQLHWTHDLLILGKSKRAEEREFYHRMATSEKWSSREVKRTINGALFERVMMSATKLSAPLRVLHPDASVLSAALQNLNWRPGVGLRCVGFRRIGLGRCAVTLGSGKLRPMIRGSSRASSVRGCSRAARDVAAARSGSRTGLPRSTGRCRSGS
jgi:hypothetical protein